ncbi:hypothetical protein GCM10015536_69440 [Streptomyces griseomycini]|nr:hypothetical protein GCM10015536_69440 [Streptomyces griseomycini]
MLWTAAAVWLVVGVLAAAAMALILVKGPGYTRDPGPAPTTPAPTTPAPTAPATPSPSTQPTAKPTAPDPTPTPSVGTPCNIFDPECPGSTGGSTGG